MNPRFRIFRAPAMAVAIALIARGVVLVSLHGTPFTRVMVGDSLGYWGGWRRYADVPRDWVSSG